MRHTLTLAAVLGLALAAPAVAQTSAAPAAGSASANSSSATSAPMQPGQMQEAVKHDLSQAGFTDIQVMPSSFLVRAKDKAGRPVMMVINPDSVTEITNIGQTGANGSGTNQSGADTTKK